MQGTEIEIRELNRNNPTEFETVLALNLREWNANVFGTDEKARKIAIEHYDDPLRYTLVAVLKGEVIGTASVVGRDVYGVYPEKDTRAEGLGYFSRLVIAEGHRDKGLGSKLLQEIDAASHKFGYKNVFLILTEGRDSQLYNFYMHRHWTDAGEREVKDFGKFLILMHAVPEPVLESVSRSSSSFKKF